MTAVVALGLCFGVAVVGAARALRAEPPPLGVALQRLQRPAARATPVSEASGLAGLGERLGRRLGARAVGAFGVRSDVLESDLRVVGSNLERHVGTKVLLGLFGVLLPPAWAALVALGGVRVPVPLVAAAAVLLGGGGFFYPDLSLGEDAERRRREFRLALGAFLDLVVVSIAGGTGVSGSLQTAARVGHGWAFGEISRALDNSQVTGETPWDALGRLGTELRVSSLSELAASVSLSGTEGARVRDSLAAKATSLRQRELVYAKAAAGSATETMAIPTVMMLAGFVILAGYPALDAILTGL
jgi:tight adherence protein C